MNPAQPSEGKPVLTEAAGYEALRGHVLAKAFLARSKYGPKLDLDAMQRMLQDQEIVRFPTHLSFDAQPLMPGEFAWPKPLGEKPSDGFTLAMHPHFEHRPRDLPLLIAYHIVAINYLDVVTAQEAELFGAALFGIEVEDYYAQVCALADELGGP